jgi:hypothetical protein
MVHLDSTSQQAKTTSFQIIPNQLVLMIPTL